MNCYYPLPEWYPQSATLLVWPHDYTDWSTMLDGINLTYVNLFKAIIKYQKVIVAYYNEEHKAEIIDLFQQHQCDLQQVIFIGIETNDTWVRDYGPQILYGATGFQYVDYEFNAWGEQYPCRLDNLFAEEFYSLIDNQRCEYYRSPIVIEGGNLEFNSQAHLLTNLACIKRNIPNLTLTNEAIINKLSEEFSVKHVLPIDVPPLKGDDTGGHIDTLARFTDDDTIVFSSTQDENNPNHACLMLLKSQLSALRNKHGKPYKLIPIPLPKNTLFDEDDNYLPANYVNFIFVNNAVIVPLHHDEHDQIAIDRLARACPNRKIIGVYANTLLQQFGSLHCATLHIPEKVLKEGIQ